MPDNDNLLEMTSDIIGAMVSNNTVPIERLPGLIVSVHAALSGLGQVPQVPAEEEKPQGAVTSRKSLADPNIIISMIDGKSYSSLKRHLTRHGYTPETYREAFGLKSDYPMVASGYSERRRELAKKIGLGRKPRVEAAAPEIAAEEAPAKKTRRSRKTETVRADEGQSTE